VRPIHRVIQRLVKRNQDIDAYVSRNQVVETLIQDLTVCTYIYAERRAERFTATNGVDARPLCTGEEYQ
jgi:hypothetical protein